MCLIGFDLAFLSIAHTPTISNIINEYYSFICYVLHFSLFSGIELGDDIVGIFLSFSFFLFCVRGNK
jgi:hypothetical protein